MNSQMKMYEHSTGRGMGKGVCSPTQKLSKSHTLGIFTEPSSHRHDQLTQSPAPALPPEHGQWG